jgi:hypothetical protein
VRPLRFPSAPRRHGAFAVFVGALVGLGGVAATDHLGRSGAVAAPPNTADSFRTLRPVADFDGIKDPQARSAALFREAGKVFASPRCLNCHPATPRPTQTDRMTPHQPIVLRGPDGTGVLGGLRCSSCHQRENFAASAVPGNAKWALAPASMAWQGKTLGEICRQIKDPKRNGGHDMAGIVHHLSEDGLVGWAWRPGGNRMPAPGTQQEFGELIKAWAASGAVCPD